MENDRADGLLGTYDANTWLLNRLVKDVTHPESLKTPDPEINSMNWILGHILSGRTEALDLLGQPDFWVEEQLALYRTGSPAIGVDSQALEFQILVEELERSQDQLAATFELISPEHLDQVVETRRGEKPIWKHIDGLAWHETFHVGQVDILRAYAHKESSQ